MTNASIIQWNAQGIRSKKNELSEMINLYGANIIAVQERFGITLIFIASI